MRLVFSSSICKVCVYHKCKIHLYGLWTPHIKKNVEHGTALPEKYFIGHRFLLCYALFPATRRLVLVQILCLPAPLCVIHIPFGKGVKCVLILALKMLNGIRPCIPKALLNSKNKICEGKKKFFLPPELITKIHCVMKSYLWKCKKNFNEKLERNVI